MGKKWEYKVEVLAEPEYGREAHLDELGAEGWELISITFEWVESEYKTCSVGHFKREKAV